MNQKSITITVMLILALGAGWLVFHKPAVAPPTPPVDEPGVTPTEPTIDTSDWKTYRNEEIGIEFMYPKSWIAHEKFIDTKNHGGNGNIFRYVLLDTGSFSVEIGVRRVNESESIFLQGWRTGMPAGNFLRDRLVDVAGGVAEIRHLVDADIPSKESTRMILYCKPNENLDEFCKPFSLGKDKLGSIGVYSVEESDIDPWQEIESVMGALVKTVSVF